MDSNTIDNKLKNLGENKLLFVLVSTNWCGFCTMFERFLQVPEIISTFAKAFDVLTINVDRDLGGKEIADKIKGDNEIGGVPWFALIKKDGTVVLSNYPEVGNLGYPVSENEPDMFIKLLEQNTSLLVKEDYEIIN